MVIKLLTGSISPQYHVVFNEIFSTVASITAADPDVWIRLFILRNSRILVMLDQEDDPELVNEWFTVNDRLTGFRKSRETIVRRIKGVESPSVQLPQSSE